MKDLTWIKYLLTGPPAEKLERKGYSAALVSVPRTRDRHNERYRYRAFFFEPSEKVPVMSVNIESDILGEYLLTIEDARGRSVRARYDVEPPFEEFRARALEEADRRFRGQSPAAPSRVRQSSRRT